MAIKTIADISATATPQRLRLPDPFGLYTLYNSGAGAAYYRCDPTALAATLAGATDTVMKAAGGSRLPAGCSVVISRPDGDVGIPYIDVACVTAVTTTVEVIAGEFHPLANMELNIGNVGLLSAAEAEINPATLESVQAVSTPVGTTADVPLDSTTTVESATARTGVSLWKRAVNMLIALLGKFGTAGSANAAVMSVQGIGGGTTLPVTEASASGIATALGTSATTAVDGDAAGVAIAHLRGINKKLAAGVGVTGAVTTSGTVTEASAASILATQNLLSGNGLTRLSTNGTAAAAGSGVVVAALANRQYRLHGLTVTMDSSAATGAWDVRDSDGTVLAGPFAAPNQGGGIAVVLPMSKLSAYVVPTAAKGISIGATGANLHFHAIYSSETV